MAKRYKPQNAAPAVLDGVSKLPIDRPIAVYYRQSTDAQIGNVSTTIQTVDMVEHLKRRGWSDDRIIMIDMDAGMSGSIGIDKRPGMRRLFKLITDAQIGAVACQDEDRLFRDVTQIQVNIFIEACRTSRVFVVTPTMVYDFASELTGTFHARQFRFKSEMAAEYINSVIRGKLHQAERHLLMEGRWVGTGVPPGFMVDMRRTLPDGSRNPQWRRYVPFEPYAEIVNDYFRIFLSHAGNVRATVREIHEHGPYYPDPKSSLPPQGFRVSHQMHLYGKGLCPGRTGIVRLLSNAAYIGHWAVNDAIVRWNNHPAIVPVDVFMRAFNYLSDATLDGRANHDYNPMQQHARPSLDEQRPVERPLCAGMIVSKDHDRWRNVGAQWVGKLKHYTYVLWAGPPRDKYVWGKVATCVDEAVSTLVIDKLRVTFDRAVWNETLASFAGRCERVRKRKLAQLAQIERVMKNLVAGLDNLTNRDMISAAQARYEDAQAERARLSTELAMAGTQVRRLEAINSLKQTFSPALENWPNLTRREKRMVLGAFIRRIEATQVEGHGLRLRIRWKDGSADESTLPHQAARCRYWLPGEAARLLELVDRDASQLEIASEFPNRKWELIRDRVSRTRGSRSLRLRPKPIKDRETYRDYLVRTRDTSLADMGSDTRSGTGLLVLPG